MALIKCPECGKDVSDKTDICINCGYPIREYVEKQAIEEQEIEIKEKGINGISYEQRKLMAKSSVIELWRRYKDRTKVIDHCQKSYGLSVVDAVEIVDNIFEEENIKEKTPNDAKLCKYCQTEIPKKAKVCPNCRKKQGGIFEWIVIAVLVIGVIGSIGGESDDESASQNDLNFQQEDVVSNVFTVGDVIETDEWKISYLSSKEYTSDNQFIKPKDGYVYWEFEFAFENVSDSDHTVSSMMDWECYADNTKVDQTWIGDDNGLDATLSSGRKTEGTIYFEVPKDAESIELEYDINFWKSDKIIFIGK